MKQKTSEIKTLYQSKQTANEGADIAKMGEVESFSEATLQELKIIYPGMANARILNIFRELRTQLLQGQRHNNFVCMVSSTNHGGGASYITKNLAAVFALDKAKTSLIIDANLYGPSIQDLIIGEAEHGITDYLSLGNIDIKDIVYATGIPRLRAIPLGSNCEGAAEYFSSRKMNAFIQEVRSRYPDRFIFIDAPPILSSSEARILSDIADIVLLVVPHGRATEPQIESAIEIVGKDKLTGLVYNN